MRLTQMRLQDPAPDDEYAACEFARQAGRGLVQLLPGDLGRGNLTLLLALSAWLRIAGIGMLPACSSLIGLRRALLEVSGLDKDREPVPLLAGDPSVALVGLSIYLHGLITRAAQHAHDSTGAVVEEALELLA